MQPWRKDPLLAGQFHPEHPDDLQVIVHEGGPRCTEAAPELIWARVVGAHQGTYEAVCLNAPHQLPSLSEGQRFRFKMTKSAEYPFLVTEKYQRERASWSITPCAECGFDELFDAPSDLIAATFAGLPEGATMESFSAFCALCAGVQVVSSFEQRTVAEPEGKRPWWRFWS